MRKRELVLLLLYCATANIGCTSENIVEVSEASAPDSLAIARYRQHLYGGAAGGVGHCISISANDDEADCLLLASKLDGLEMCWIDNRTLIVAYRDGRITSFHNKLNVARADGLNAEYEVRLMHLFSFDKWACPKFVESNR